jgi:hypothetical protein
MNSGTIIKSREETASVPLNTESERGRLWWGESWKLWRINRSTLLILGPVPKYVTLHSWLAELYRNLLHFF